MTDTLKVRAWLMVLRMMLDGLALWLGMNVAYWLRFSDYHALFGLAAPNGEFTGYPLQTLFFSGIMLVVLLFQGRYSLGTRERLKTELRELFWALTGAFGILILVFFFWRIFFFSRFVFALAWGLAFFFIALGRFAVRSFEKSLAGRGIGQIRVLFFGKGDVASPVRKALNKDPLYEIIHELKNTKETQTHLEYFRPEEFIIATKDLKSVDTAELTRLAHRYHARLRYVPDEMALDLSHVTTGAIGGVPVLTMHYTAFEGWGTFLKQIIDILLAILLLILLSPLLILIAIKVKKEHQDAPVLYVSERIGQNGKPFSCYKFRSMIPGADKLKQKLKSERKGVLFKMQNDPRITKFGKFLRESSLDELPQLFNVIKGEMSLVGPRAHLPEEVEKYELDDQRILGVRPGITGYAQINGRSKNSYSEEMRYELYYVQNWSIWLDFYIMWKTFWVVIKRENAS